MLSKTGLLLAAAFVVTSAGVANASSYDHHGRHRTNSFLTISIGDVAFGYSDGYWDNNHRWHHWRNRRDQQNYRSHGGNYHNWNHNRDGDHGWSRH